MIKRNPKFIFNNTSNKNEILKHPLRSSKKTKKNQITLLGWIDRHKGTPILRPFSKDIDIHIFFKKEELTKNQASMHTIVRATLFPLRKRVYEGKIIEVFPSLDDPALEEDIVTENYGLPTVFSKESQSISPPHKIENRQNLTHCTTVTIDGEKAKDFDDAISVEKDSDGIFNLKVSIADVSHFVPEHSFLDQEAYHRGTSVYFPNSCLPMLPPILSENDCSLIPNEERMALTVDLKISPEGEVLQSKIYPSVIKSHARLTYVQVFHFFKKQESNLVTSVKKMLELAWELSQILRKRRKERGALDLDLPECEFEVLSNGDVKNIYRAEQNEANHLIEDFMILANEVVSQKIEARGFPSLYRVHETPDPLKIETLQQIMKKWNFRFSKSGNLLQNLQHLLDSVRNHPHKKTLVLAVLRSLKQARYSANNCGHFGLASSSYCHFTSPIRRYPDLLIHRILRKTDFLKSKTSPWDLKQLEKTAEHCSFTEQRAFKAEREMEDMKKVRFMVNHLGKTFTGVITSVKSFGMFVELMTYPIEGLIPIRSLPQDFWHLDSLETKLEGRRSHVQFQLGDVILVQVNRVDRLRRHIDFRYLQHNAS